MHLEEHQNKNTKRQFKKTKVISLVHFSSIKRGPISLSAVTTSQDKTRSNLTKLDQT